MIRHKGIVREIRDDKAVVSIISESACSACHSKGSCLVSETAEKDVLVDIPGKELHPGMEVNILLKDELGFRAVIYGYLLPFVVLIAFLLAGVELSGNELYGAFIALTGVGIYYITLFFFRKNLKKVFKFELEEINNS